MSETTIKTKDQVLGEIRYAQRLAQRTARLYRRIQAFSTFWRYSAARASCRR